ncbi:MAG: protein kinase, partial [Actinomycetota bacterium]
MLEHPAANIPPSSPDSQADSGDRAIGRLLGGRYELQALLGSGASAHVYLAGDRSLGRQVAVKCLRSGLNGDERFRRRFRAEAQAAAQLGHPNLLAVFDWGEDPDAYLVTELLMGGSLQEVLDHSGRLSPSQGLLIALQAAQGLQYAHEFGIVHRDIKPANLLFGEEGRLRVGDFGIARAVAEAAWTEPEGVLVGTARYAAPEQALGDSIGDKTDVYSLALTVIEAVTGRVPLVRENALATMVLRQDRDVVEIEELGALGPALLPAGRADPEARPSANELIENLTEAARHLPRPERLPLVSPVDLRRRSSMSVGDRPVDRSVDRASDSVSGVIDLARPTPRPGSRPDRRSVAAALASGDGDPIEGDTDHDGLPGADGPDGDPLASATDIAHDHPPQAAADEPDDDATTLGVIDLALDPAGGVDRFDAARGAGRSAAKPVGDKPDTSVAGTTSVDAAASARSAGDASDDTRAPGGSASGIPSKGTSAPRSPAPRSTAPASATPSTGETAGAGTGPTASVRRSAERRATSACATDGGSETPAAASATPGPASTGEAAASAATSAGAPTPAAGGRDVTVDRDADARADRDADDPTHLAVDLADDFGTPAFIDTAVGESSGNAPVPGAGQPPSSDGADAGHDVDVHGYRLGDHGDDAAADDHLTAGPDPTLGVFLEETEPRSIAVGTDYETLPPAADHATTGDAAADHGDHGEVDGLGALDHERLDAYADDGGEPHHAEDGDPGHRADTGHPIGGGRRSVGTPAAEGENPTADGTAPEDRAGVDPLTGPATGRAEASARPRPRSRSQAQPRPESRGTYADLDYGAD